MKASSIVACSIVFASVWIAPVFAGARNNGVMDMHAVLPERVDEWRAEGEDRVFTRETIFDYMNGAGEIYLAYDFEELTVREYVNPSGPPIVVEVYRMGSAEDAYGIFTHDTEGADVDVGDDGIYSSGFLMFRKGNVFVRILAERDAPEVKPAIMQIAKHAAGAIVRRGTVPQLVSCLPAGGLRRREIRYFHTPLSLGIHYYIADTNILGLSDKTDVVLARYDRGDQSPRMLVAAYPSAEGAKQAYEQFVRTYLEESPTGTDRCTAPVEKGEYVGARLFAPFVVLVFEASTDDMCEDLTGETIEKLMEVVE